MCRANIEMAEEAGDLRSQMQVIRSCDMQPVRERYEAVKARAEELRSRYDLHTVLAGLKDRAAEADAAAERLSEEMVEGKVPVDAFVENYKKLREAFHRDATKVAVVEPHVRQHQGTRHQPPQPPQRHRHDAAGRHPGL